MQIKFNGNKNALSAMFVNAERYALGRKTYIVQWTCEIIAKNLDLITLNDKRVMISDIYAQRIYGYGMKCDKDCWLRLMKILKESVRKEEINEDTDYIISREEGMKHNYKQNKKYL